MTRSVQNFRITSEVKKAAKLAAVDAGRCVSSMYAMMVEDWLERKGYLLSLKFGWPETLRAVPTEALQACLAEREGSLTGEGSELNDELDQILVDNVVPISGE